MKRMVLCDNIDAPREAQPREYPWEGNGFVFTASCGCEAKVCRYCEGDGWIVDFRADCAADETTSECSYCLGSGLAGNEAESQS